jgi:dihydropteroate synthase
MNTHLWRTARRDLRWHTRPLIMGILNVTPDSFSDSGQFLDPPAAVARALEMESAGADIIDVGGESTRPGAEPVEAKEELRRVLPALEKLAGKIKIPISIDTTKAEVARRALEAGAEIVNDVSGGEWDARLWNVVAEKKAGYVLMHCQGKPADKFRHEDYADVVGAVAGYLENRLFAAQKAGIERERIVIDPGFGFGKAGEENMALLAHIDQLARLERPVLAGLSRKSFLKEICGKERLETGTMAAQIIASLRGAAIWRVHDVAAAMAAMQLMGLPADD